MARFDIVIRVPCSGSEAFESRLLRHLTANNCENIRVQVKPMNGDDTWETLAFYPSKPGISTQRRDV